MPRDVKHLLQAARGIVVEAGNQASQIPPASRVPIREKAYGDIVTDGDLAVQDHVVTQLRSLSPGYGIDSEEMDRQNPEAEYVWVLDPIDGTKYYARDVPLYSVSLALNHRNEPVIGIVYCPDLNRLYCACADEEPTLNDKAIHCSAVDRLEQASICLEIPSRYASHDEQRWAIGKMSVLTERCYRVRIIGVGSLGLCFCAAAGFDAYVNLSSLTKPHDTAAGEAIVRGAQGDFLRVGKERRQIIAGPAGLCDEICKLLGFRS